MPALPNADRILLLRLKGSYGGQPWNVIQHLQYTGAAPTTGDLSTLSTSITSYWNTNYAPLCAIGVNLTGLDLADLTNPASAAGSFTVSSAGSRAGTIMSAQNCIVVSWIINVRYRGGHPRSYYPFGVIADLATTRSWSTAFVASVNSASNAYRTALNALAVSGTTYKMAAISYRRNNAALTTPVPYTINSNATHQRVDTQRRRLGKEIP